MRGSSLRGLGFVALVATVAACEPPTDPIDGPSQRLVIHGVLDAGSPLQNVKVEYIDGSFGHRPARVAGAEVTVTAPDGVVHTATEINNSDVGLHYRFLDFFPPNQLVPGGTYTLRVRTAAGEEASGSTTIPESTDIPPSDVIGTLVRARDTVRMSWNRVPLAARYEVVVQNIFVHEGRQIRELTYRSFADTSIAIAGTARTLENDAVFRPGHSALVQVMAVDDNYYTYYHLNVDPFAGAPPSRLNGAVGVFGSIARVRTREYREIQ